MTAEKVRKKIRQLRKNSAPGPDGISPEILKSCEEELAPVLAAVYRKSLREAAVPDEWKQANVVPIYKKGTKSCTGNYRPVSLTSICCKILEGILRDDMVEHLKRNRLVTEAQHGFMRNKSCTTNLLEFLETVTRDADEGKPQDIIYLDFAKAFDKVPHRRLVKKMEAFGIRGDVLNWVREWLRDRQARVLVQGKKSTWRKVLSGVPQGSVLGPILFVIFINDLEDEIMESQLVKMFADDTKIRQVVENRRDSTELQQTLNKLWEWSIRWGMAFNVKKCHVMHIGRKNERNSYELGGLKLGAVDSERDVGVIITDDMKPTAHCQRAARTGGAVLNQIMRAFHYRDRHVFVRLYTTYVRPHLEYAAPAWSPWTRGDVELLERVQQRAVRAVAGLEGRTYEDRLLELGLSSLEHRRKELDLVQAYKILSGKDDVKSDLWFRRVTGDRRTRATTGRDNLRQERSRHEYRAN